MSKRDDAPQLSGYLSKRGPSGLTGWKQRWFEARDDRLYYMKSQGDADYLDFIPLRNVNCVFSTNDIPGLSSKHHGCSFVVDTGERVYYLLANTRDEMWMWVEGLERLRKLALQKQENEPITPKHISSTSFASSSSNLPTSKQKAEEEIKEAVMEDGVLKGYLSKRGPSSLTGFKQRWFEVSEDRISYFRSKGDSEPIAIVPIESVNYVTPSNNIAGLAKKHMGSAFLIDTENRIFYLVASSKEDMWKWVDLIGKNRKKLMESSDANSDLVALHTYVKKTPMSCYVRLHQLLTGKDFALVGSMSEVVHDKPLFASCYCRLMCINGFKFAATKWASVHYFSTFQNLAAMKKWQPNTAKACVSLVAHMLATHDKQFMDAVCWDIDPQMERLKKKSASEIIEAIVNSFVKNWHLASRFLRYLLLQASFSMHMRFAVQENLAFGGAITLLLHAMLSPSISTISPSILEMEARSKTDLARNAYLNLTFEQLASLIYDEDDDQAQRVDVFACLTDVVIGSELVRRTLFQCESYVFDDSSNGRDGDESEEKEILGILHHHLSMNIEKVISHMSKHMDAYGYINIVEQKAGQSHEAESENEVGDTLYYRVILVDQPIAAPEVPPQSSQTPTPTSSARTSIGSSSPGSFTSTVQALDAPCQRPQCGCTVYEPHLWIKDKCRLCLHTKSEHVGADDGSEASATPLSPRTRDATTPNSSRNSSERPVGTLRNSRILELESLSSKMNIAPKQVSSPMLKPRTTHDMVLHPIQHLHIALALCDVEWMREKTMHQLVSVLAKNDFTLVKLLYDLSTEPDKITRSIISACEASGQSLKLLKWAVGTETEQTTQETTLFRSDSLATRLCKAYTSTVGLPYLRETLSGCVREVLQNAEKLEVDSFRLTSPEDAEGNMVNLLSACDKFLRAIYDSVSNCPPVIRHLCAHVQRIVASKFPDSQYTAIGGFMFLRFLVSGIMYPEKYGIVEGPPSEPERRALILVAKVLQNLSNGAEFNGAKEPFMIPANRFILENSSAIQKYFKSLGEVKSQETSNKFTNSIILCHTIESDIDYIHKQLSELQDAIVVEFSKFNANHASQPKVRMINIQRIAKTTPLSQSERIRRSSENPTRWTDSPESNADPCLSPRTSNSLLSALSSAVQISGLSFKFTCNPMTFAISAAYQSTPSNVQSAQSAQYPQPAQSVPSTE